MNRIDELSAYQRFHADRISDVVHLRQTPCNDHNDGLTSCGNFLFNDKKNIACEVISALREMDIISGNHERLIEKLIGCDDEELEGAEVVITKKL